MPSRSGFGIFSLSTGRHPAAHVVSVGHPLLLHAHDARIGQPGNSSTHTSLLLCEKSFSINSIGRLETSRVSLEPTLSLTGCQTLNRYDVLVLHSGRLHHSSDRWVSSTAEEEEEDIHPHRLLHLLHYRLLQHHTSKAAAHLSQFSPNKIQPFTKMSWIFPGRVVCFQAVRLLLRQRDVPSLPRFLRNCINILVLR